MNIIFLAAILSIETFSPCGLNKSASLVDGGEVSLQGYLILTGHNSFISADPTGKDVGCDVFAVFPGTPDVMIPGISLQARPSDPAINNFLLQYQQYLSTHRNKFKLFEFKGIVKVKKGSTARRGSPLGFGYQNRRTVALVLTKVIEISK